MKKVLSFALIVLAVLIIGFGNRWYAYISNTESPYDEVGITLNTYMPQPIRAWGCAKLHANFPKALPPYGCSRPGGAAKEWLQ